MKGKKTSVSLRLFQLYPFWRNRTEFVLGDVHIDIPQDRECVGIVRARLDQIKLI
jgi:hypothetical protein